MMKKQPMQCPKCGSSLVEKLNFGRTGGAVVGGLAGLAASATRHEMIGKSLDAAASKIASIGTGSVNYASGQLTRMTGVGVAAGLAFAAAGIGIGALAGIAIDKSIIKNCKCHNCSHSFSEQ